MTSNEPEIKALLDKQIDAIEAKDIDRLMALYTSDAVYFDVVPPLRFTGSDEVRSNFLRWFDEYEGPIGLERHELNVETSGDAAFVHLLYLDSGTRKEGVPVGEVWLRASVGLRRTGGEWLIAHEHISLPGGWLNEDA